MMKYLFITTAFLLILIGCKKNTVEDDCSVRDLIVEVGECTSDSTYTIELDFIYDNPGGDSFEVFVRNNQLIGTFSLSELPLTITNFPVSGSNNDYLKVCISDMSDCCEDIEWDPPLCASTGNCVIRDIEVEVGECTSDSTYNIELDFIVANQTSDTFDLFVRNNQLVGTYLLSDLPLTLTDFEMSGVNNDYIKICIRNNPDCCKEFEWDSPKCGLEECDIRDLEVEVGECTSDSTYTITIDFIHENAGNDYFDLYVRNNQLIGTYLLTDLPVTITNFELSGGNDDFLKVCINDMPDCCVVTEWTPPDCE